MFARKTTKKKVVVPSIETRTIEVPTAHGLKEAIVPAAAAAAAMAKSYGQDASEWAQPHLEQGREIAAKQAAQAKDLLGEVKDRTGDNTGKKLAALAATGVAAKKEAAERSRDAALVLQGKAVVKQKKKKGGGLGKLVLNLGLLTAVGAAVAVAVQKLTQPKDDPWARPLTDPYVAPAPKTGTTTASTTGTPAAAKGTDQTVAAGEGAKVTEVKTGDVEGSQVTDKAETTEIIVPEGQVRTEGENKNI